MDFEKIEKALDRIKKIKRQLDKINDGRADIELRVYTTGEWSNIDFKPRNKAILNMVVHQIKMDLESELKECEIIIKENAIV